jgi:hypothetical protein
LFLLAACGGNGDDGDKKTDCQAASGDACSEENATICGCSLEGAEAVLICVPVDDKGNRKWTEQALCSKAQFCETKEGASSCVIDCESPYVCEGKDCGDDGCGGSCGACPAGSQCVAGACQEYVCEPQCGGSQCGPDGCGGECGVCQGAQVCDPVGYLCVPLPAGCTPSCMNRQCGPNGCGGSCGKCEEGTFCQPGAQLCSSACVPNCAGKVCGDNGCGGSCGGCIGENLFCTADGQCKPCDPIKNEGCPEGNYCTYVGADGPLCDVAGTQAYGELCGGLDSCKEGVCIELSGTEGGARCYRICAVHSDCGEGKQCMDLQNSAYKVCTMETTQTQSCDLLKQDCKLETDGCYITSGTAGPICATAGTKKEGESCSGQPNDCMAGFSCLSTPKGGTICQKFCNTEKGEEPLCGETFPKCQNYYAKQFTGICQKP